MAERIELEIDGRRVAVPAGCTVAAAIAVNTIDASAPRFRA